MRKHPAPIHWLADLRGLCVWTTRAILKGSTVFMRHGTLIENTSKLEIKFKSLEFSIFPAGSDGFHLCGTGAVQGRPAAVAGPPPRADGAD